MPNGSRGSSAKQVLASLNHPNIGAIYGFEDGGVHALVLEPTLVIRKHNRGVRY